MLLLCRRRVFGDELGLIKQPTLILRTFPQWRESSTHNLIQFSTLSLSLEADVSPRRPGKRTCVPHSRLTSFSAVHLLHR